MRKIISVLLIAVCLLSLAGCSGQKGEDTREKLGVVVAIEIDAVLSRYGEPSDTIEDHGYSVRVYENDSYVMYVVDSGAGEISAATAAQLLISEYDVDMILNFGVVGALTEEIKTAEYCIVDSVIHYDFDSTDWLDLPRGQYPDYDTPYMKTTQELVDKVIELEPSINRVVCASADKFIGKAEDKTALHEAYGADICEMESAGLVLTCDRNNVPVLILKAVSDSLTGGGKEFYQELERVSGLCFDLVDRVVNALYG